jgi:cytochrome P450
VSKVRIWNGDTPWLITRFADQRAILNDRRFSADVRRKGYPYPSAGVKARRTESLSFISLDDPEHAAGRRILTKYFRIKRMEELRGRVQAIADSLVDDMLRKEAPVDLVEDYALPLPSLVICELLGVPYEDHAFFQDHSTKLVSRASTPEESSVAIAELRRYLLQLVDAKDENPGDDITSRLVLDHMRSGALTREEIADLGSLVLVAGHETTANVLALSTLALLTHPDQLVRVRDTEDPAVVAAAVEELLRYVDVAHSGRRRVAIEDVEVAGQLIRAGEGVIIASVVGNRDAEAFPDPDVLDVGRGARNHMSFGFGNHQCLGAPLARLELQVAIPTLLRRIPTLDLAIPFDEVRFREDMAVYGVHALPVRW